MPLGVDVPGAETGTFETIAGYLLILLGLVLLLDHFELGVHRHDHDGSAHRHVALGQQFLGTGHQHVDVAALAVGVVHGLAGSGALVVGLVATASSLPSGAAFLGGFLGASLLTMAGLSVVWHRAGSSGMARPLQIGAGILAIGIGLGMVLPSML